MRKVPKLRFKEFSDEWEEKKLGDILEFKNGVNASKEQYGKGIKFINVLDILNNDFITYDNIIGKVDIDNNTVEKYSVTYGDILFQRSSETREEVGMANVYLDKKNIATFGGFVIRGKKIGEYIPIFLNKLLKTNLARNEITSKSGGSTRYNVGQETLKDVRLLFPILQEQEKIANFLSSVDKKISLTEEKLELFREYKKGVMQKIFSQELRFKDSNGNDYPEWNLVYTKDISKITMGFTPSTKDEKMWNGQYKWLSIADLKENGKYIYKTSKTITDKGIKNKKILSKGTLVMSFKLTLGRVGILADNMFTNEAICHFHWLEKDKINTEYIYYYLSNIDIINFGKQAVKGITLNTESLNSIEVQLPCYEEQQKIADFLSSIDSKIESIEKELEGLKEFKRGLLQQMFI